MHTIKHLTNKKIKPGLLDDFLSYINGEMKIDTPYSVYFVEDKENASEALGKTAMYNPSTKSVYVYVTNRHPKDILRSIAHELVHHKQNCNGDLENMSLEKAEVQANAGGYYLRKYEDQLKENKLREEVAGRVVAPTKGYGEYDKCLPHQVKHGDYCVPKGFDVNKSVTGGPNWTLEDVEQARKDLWVRQGNKIGENADMFTSKRKSVFERLKDPLLRKMVLDRYFFPVLKLKLNRFKMAPLPPNFQKSKEYANYTDRMVKEITKPHNMQFFGNLLLKFAGTKGFPKLSTAELERLSAGVKEKGKTDAVRLPSPVAGDPDGTDFRNIWQQILAKQQSVNEQKKSKTRFKIYDTFTTDGAYLIYKLFDKKSKTGLDRYDRSGRVGPERPSGYKLRVDVIDPEDYTVSDAMRKSIIDLVKVGDENEQDIYKKAEEIYRVSPFSEKSRRAINAADDKNERNLIISLAVLGALPLPAFWIFDLAASTYYLNKAVKETSNKGGSYFQQFYNFFDNRNLYDGLLAGGMGLVFSPAKADILKANKTFKNYFNITEKTKSVEAAIIANDRVAGALSYLDKIMTRIEQKADNIIPSAKNAVTSRVGKGEEVSQGVVNVLDEYEGAWGDTLSQVRQQREAVKKHNDVFTELTRLIRGGAPAGTQAAFDAAIRKFGAGEAYNAFAKYLGRKGGRLRNYVQQNLNDIVGDMMTSPKVGFKRGGLAPTSEASNRYDEMRDFYDLPAWDPNNAAVRQEWLNAVTEDASLYMATLQRETNALNTEFLRDIDAYADQKAAGAVASDVDYQKARKTIDKFDDGKGLTTDKPAREIAEEIYEDQKGVLKPDAAANRTEAAFKKDVEEAVSGKPNELSEIFESFEGNALDQFSPQVFGRVGTGAKVAKGAVAKVAAKAARSRTVEGIIKQYFTGGGYFKEAYAFFTRLTKGKNFFIRHLPKVAAFITLKFSIPYMLYLRIYRPICGVTIGEFTKALTSGSFADIVLGGGAFNLLQKSTDAYITELMKKGYIHFNANSNLTKTFCKSIIKAGQKEPETLKFLERELQKVLIEMEAFAKEAHKKASEDPKVIAAQKKLAAAQKEAARLKELAKTDPMKAAQEAGTTLQDLGNEAADAAEEAIPDAVKQGAQKAGIFLKKAAQAGAQSVDQFCKNNPNSFACKEEPVPTGTPEEQAAAAAKRAAGIKEGLTLSDYREKLLNERLEKLTIGFTK